MGADIHGVLQSRFSNDGNWWTECEIEDTRHYALFSALADVRNYYSIKPISDPRGLPEDFPANDDQEHGYRKTWMGDHSYTWLTLEEIRDWPGWDEVHIDPIEKGTWVLRETCETFLKWVDYAASKCGGYDKGRIVIGFDS
jgi:hypothetical protein